MRRFSSAQISATCHNACNDLKSTTGKVVMSASTKVQSQAHKPDLPVEVDGLLAELRMGRSRYNDGELASARRHRNHLGLQFPGRSLGMECGAGARMRQQHRLEAVGEDAVDGARNAGAARACPQALQAGRRDGAGGSLCGAVWRA